LAGDRIDITETIFFEEGKATLMPASERVLTAVWQIMAENPQVGPLLIGGHTNSNGSETFNLRLSDARAFEVMRWLAERGIDPARLVSKGYGEAQPLVPDTDPEAASLNRRVEFRVLPAGAMPDGARQVDPGTLEMKAAPVVVAEPATEPAAEPAGHAAEPAGHAAESAEHAAEPAGHEASGASSALRAEEKTEEETEEKTEEKTERKRRPVDDADHRNR
jgi:hypothetical protein